MKLTKFKELWSSVNNYELDRIQQTEINIFNDVGLDTNLNDIFDINDTLVTVLKDGTIRKTIVYISEIKKWILDEYGNYPKFHIYNCRTLIKMRNNNKQERYKKTLRNDGTFMMVISGTKDSETKFIKLEVCGNCLIKFKTHYNKPSFDVKKYIKSPISKDKFNKLDYVLFKDDLETVPKYYASNWNKISNELKKLKNYTCQNCMINLETAKKYLHTHHIDSNPSNNDIASNLKVLCIECHSNEFQHTHIKSNPSYENFIQYKKRL